QVGEVVADVFSATGDDAVAALERDRGEDGIPGACRVLEQSDLARGAVDQAGCRVVDVVEVGARRILRFVAPDASLELQVSNDLVDHGPGHQRRAGVVEVEALLTAGRLGPDALDVDRHNGTTVAQLVAPR